MVSKSRPLPGLQELISTHKLAWEMDPGEDYSPAWCQSLPLLGRSTPIPRKLQLDASHLCSVVTSLEKPSGACVCIKPLSLYPRVLGCPFFFSLQPSQLWMYVYLWEHLVNFCLLSWNVNSFGVGIPHWLHSPLNPQHCPCDQECSSY